MKQYRICKLDGCDVWRIEHLAAVRWPFRYWVQPQWKPVYESSIFALECPPRPVERSSHMSAVTTLEGYERSDREQEARRAKAWTCGPMGHGL